MFLSIYLLYIYIYDSEHILQRYVSILLKPNNYVYVARRKSPKRTLYVNRLRNLEISSNVVFVLAFYLKKKKKWTHLQRELNTILLLLKKTMRRIYILPNVRFPPIGRVT